MNNTYYGKLIFELSKEGRRGYSLPANPWAAHHTPIPAQLQRTTPAALPEADEQTVARHYTNMSNNNADGTLQGEGKLRGMYSSGSGFWVDLSHGALSPVE